MPGWLPKLRRWHRWPHPWWRWHARHPWPPWWRPHRWWSPHELRRRAPRVWLRRPRWALELHLHRRRATRAAHGRHTHRRANDLRVCHRRRREVRHRGPRDLRLHHARGRTAHAPNRARETGLGLEERASGHTASGGASDASAGERATASGRLDAGLVRRGRALDGHGDDLLAAEEEEAERPPLLALAGGLGGLGGRELAELLAVAEDEVHVAIEGHEFPHELSSVLDRHAHPVVDELEHLRPLGVRHGGWCADGGAAKKARLGFPPRGRSGEERGVFVGFV